MAQDKINMPSGYGGLLRYDEEMPSKFVLKPSHIVIFVVAIVVVALILKFAFPITG